MRFFAACNASHIDMFSSAFSCSASASAEILRSYSLISSAVLRVVVVLVGGAGAAVEAAAEDGGFAEEVADTAPCGLPKSFVIFPVLLRCCGGGTV